MISKDFPLPKIQNAGTKTHDSFISSPEAFSPDSSCMRWLGSIICKPNTPALSSDGFDKALTSLSSSSQLPRTSHGITVKACFRGCEKVPGHAAGVPYRIQDPELFSLPTLVTQSIVDVSRGNTKKPSAK